MAGSRPQVDVPISYVKSYQFHSPRMRERGESVDLESLGGESLDEGLGEEEENEERAVKKRQFQRKGIRLSYVFSEDEGSRVCLTHTVYTIHSPRRSIRCSTHAHTRIRRKKGYRSQRDTPARGITG